MLDGPNHQGKFGEDYVRVLASAAGLLVSKYDLDRDGVDLGFRYPGRGPTGASPTIEAQIKSWSRPRAVDGHLTYRELTEPQFNKLAGDDYTVPRFLFIVHVPDDPAAYADFLPDGVLLRHLGYFRSLHTETRVDRPDRQRRRSVTVPTSNVLTVETLRELVLTEGAA